MENSFRTKEQRKYNGKKSCIKTYENCDQTFSQELKTLKSKQAYNGKALNRDKRPQE